MGGGTRQPQIIHPQHVINCSCPRSQVNAPKNCHRYLFPGLPPQHFVMSQPPYGNISSRTNPALRSMKFYPSNHERNSYPATQASQHLNYSPVLSQGYNNTPQINVDQAKISEGYNLGTAEMNGRLPDYYQYSMVPAFLPHMPIMTPPPGSAIFKHKTAYDTWSPNGSEFGTVIINGGHQFGGNQNLCNVETNGFHHDYNSGSFVHGTHPPPTYPHTPYIHGQGNYGPVTQPGSHTTSANHYNLQSSTLQSTQPGNNTSSNHYNLQSNTAHPAQAKSHDDPNRVILQETAHNFVEDFCPLLGDEPYCLPPIKRYIHQDKQLVQGQESEKRVFGSFERFFAERQIPVLMLCHYPMTGFMQVYYGSADLLNRVFTTSFDKNGKDTVTLLLSHLFSVTIVTVSMINGNSDLAYIQRSVMKAAAHMKKCSDTVSGWLTFLGVRPDVKGVIAFPNLKRAMMHRVGKDKQFRQQFGSVCTLHVEDLSAPFEEEWSTPAHKLLFSDWMQRNVLCHRPTLSRGDVHLVVGALLSPRLSKVEFVHDERAIEPIPEFISYSVTSENNKENVSQLKLTIDGSTKPFDEFMNEYITCYFPNVENETYRVPPIHFNIQSLKKPTEYFHSIRENSPGNGMSSLKAILGKADEAPEDNLPISAVKNDGSSFMPQCHSYKMVATSNYNSCDNQGVSSEFRASESGTVVHMAPNFPLVSQTSNSASPTRLLGVTSTNLSQTVARLEELGDVKVLTQVMPKDGRADEGENRVINAFELLGHQYKPMFIICGYQYNNYLNKLREEMFSKEESSRPVRAFGQTMRAEHDCLIFHKKYGAIIVCIKAVGDNFEDWSASEEQKILCTNKILEKAVKQLEREEAMIKHVTSDLQANLACHKLIALPNMSRENVEQALSADDKLAKKIMSTLNHGAELFLCSDELPPKDLNGWDDDLKTWKKLENWWKKVQNLFNKEDSEGITLQVYKQLIGRYVGLFSTVEVWSATNPRVEVRSESEAVSICAQRFRKMVLLPHQIMALCSNDRRMFLYGPPGSGKTLVLILKAREWLLGGERVFLINSRPGSEHGFPYAYGVLKKLKLMMRESKVRSYKLDMISVDPLKFRPDELPEIMPCSCIIMDEVTAASHQIIEYLSSLQLKSIWCAGLFEDDKPITAHSFYSHKMDKILRCPPIVQSLLKRTEPDVRLLAPYKNNYQSSVLEKDYWIVQKSNKENYNTQDKMLHSEGDDCLKDQNPKSGTRAESFQSATELLNDRLIKKYDSGFQKVKGSQFSSELENNREEDDNQVRKFHSNEDGHLIDQNMKSGIWSEPCQSHSELLNDRLVTKYGSKHQQAIEAQSTNQQKNDGEKDSRRVSELNAEDGDNLHGLNMKSVIHADQNLKSVIHAEQNLKSIIHADQNMKSVIHADQNMKSVILTGSFKYASDLLHDRLVNKYGSEFQKTKASGCAQNRHSRCVTVMFSTKTTSHSQSYPTIGFRGSTNTNQVNYISGGRKANILFPDYFYYFEKPVLKIKTIRKTVESEQESQYEKIQGKFTLKSHTRNKEQISLSENIFRTCEPDFKEETAINIQYNPEMLKKSLQTKYNDNPQFSKEPLSLEKPSTESSHLSGEERVKELISEPVVQNQDVSKASNETLNYDPESLNKRLVEKYESFKSSKLHQEKQEDMFYYSRNSTEISLPTDGPRPHIIDHSNHLKPGIPTDCSVCGEKLADFLISMIRPEGMSVISRNRHNQNKKKHGVAITNSGRGQSGKTDDTVIFTNLSSIHKKLSAFPLSQKLITSLEHRTLTWSDVLVVAREMPTDCAFLSALRKRSIPVEVLMNGQTSEIENSKDKKLFITSYKEVTGIERALIVFVPSQSPNHGNPKLTTTGIVDMQLGQCLNHFAEEDRIALWFVASRCLASLVLILP